MTTWSVPFNRLAQGMRENVDKTVQRFTFNLFTAVVLRSPVDTGRFRANWNVSPNKEDMTTSFTTNTQRSFLELQKIFRIPAGGFVYLSNGLHYAQKLEFGGSVQAPGGMIRISVAEANLHMRKALRE